MISFLKKIFTKNYPEDDRVVLGFWGNLPSPIWALAPMADVTDQAFRRIIAKYSRAGQPAGGPDVFWTEFVSVDGLLSPGREVLQRDLDYTESERPLVAQIFGAKPDNFERIAQMLVEQGFDGIDINMGCPDRSVNKQGAGAALCKTPQLAQDIIRATKRGAGNIPVSVKVRLGWNHDETEKWMPALLKTKPAVITIHARTRQDMSKTDPSWTAVKRAVELRDKISPETKIIANGGIMNHEQGRDVISQTGCDGIMMGKAVFGNPWLFDENHKPPSVTEKLTVMLEHTKLFTELLGDIKNFAIMKKHYKAYANGFSGAKELRIKLMTAITPQDVENYVDNFLLSYEK